MNNAIDIELKKAHDHAVLPTRNHDNIIEGDKIQHGTHDSGFDIYACEETIIPKRGSIKVPTGLVVAYIQPGWWFRIESRSGLSFKKSILAHPGIIDNGYRGSLDIKMYNHSDEDYTVLRGDKIAQMVAYPLIEINLSWSKEVKSSHRGEMGFGSSGR